MLSFFFFFTYFGQILLQNVLCTTLLVENSTHQVILIPMSDLVCSLKYCNALLLQNQFFFSFFFIFTYVSDQIWINQSDHQNVHKIPDLFMYNMSKVVNFAERFDLILMCEVAKISRLIIFQKRLKPVNLSLFSLNSILFIIFHRKDYIQS